MLDIFQTGVTSMKWRKWCMETSQTVTVTGHCRPSILVLVVLELFLITTTLLPPCQVHTHALTVTHANTHSLNCVAVCLFLGVFYFLSIRSNRIMTTSEYQCSFANTAGTRFSASSSCWSQSVLDQYQ